MPIRPAEIVRTALKSMLKDLPEMETDADLYAWLEERKRYRDINQAEIERLESDYEALALKEEEALKRFKSTEPHSLMRRKCLAIIGETRKRAEGIEQVRAVRQTNVDVNSRFIIEIEKAIAAGDVGMDASQIDAMSRTFEDSIRKWYVEVDSVNQSKPQDVGESYRDDLADLERELEREFASAAAPESNGIVDRSGVVPPSTEPA